MAKKAPDQAAFRAVYPDVFMTSRGPVANVPWRKCNDASVSGPFVRLGHHIEAVGTVWAAREVGVASLLHALMVDDRARRQLLRVVEETFAAASEDATPASGESEAADPLEVELARMAEKSLAPQLAAMRKDK